MEPTTAARAEKLKVTFLPKETSTRVPSGTTLFHAAAWTGQPIESTCGGRGTCGKCRVQVIEGSAPITPADQQHLSQDDISAGWRLSCQAEVRDEMVVQVPRLLTTPKPAMFGVGRQVLLDPTVHKVHLRLAEPTLHDQRADYLRLKDRFELEIVDVYQQPSMIQDEQVFATPTLIKYEPAPLRRIIGDMSDIHRLCFGLGLAYETPT